MTASGMQAALDFLNAMPALVAAGRVEPAAIPARVDYPALAAAATACGYTCEADDISEAFRVFLRARLASATRPR